MSIDPALCSLTTPDGIRYRVLRGHLVTMADDGRMYEVTEPSGRGSRVRSTIPIRTERDFEREVRAAERRRARIYSGGAK